MTRDLVAFVEIHRFSQTPSANGAAFVVPNEIIETAVEVECSFHMVPIQNIDDFLVVDGAVIDGYYYVSHILYYREDSRVKHANEKAP